MSLEREEPKTSPGQRAASAALARTIAAGPVVAGMKSEMSQHAAALARMRSRNHFAASLEAMYGDRDRRGRS